MPGVAMPRHALLLLALSGAACAAPAGTPAQLFASHVPTFGAGRRGFVPLATSVRVPTPDGDVDVDVERSALDAAHGNYYSAVGAVAGRAGTRWQVSGTPANATGVLAYEEEGRAFRYTTDAHGVLQAEPVVLDEVRAVCGAHQHGDHAHRDSAPLAVGAGAGEYIGEDLRRLQSDPASANVLMLDIGMHYVDEAAGDAVKRHDKAYFHRMWRAVAGAYATFDLNVATDWDAYNAAPIGQRGLACFVGGSGRSYAYLNTFGVEGCGSWNKLEDYDEGNGLTVMHEVGHMLGLNHDGKRRVSAYFGGFEAYEWVPVMGNYLEGVRTWADPLFQWSRGEYDGAKNREDDLAIIAGKVGRRADDVVGHADLAVGAGGVVAAADNAGSIGGADDADAFRFRVAAGGDVDLTVARAGHVWGAMLDVDATLRAVGGAVVAQANPVKERDARVAASGLAAGDYELVVRGGAEGTPAEGFSAYSSIGKYTISGVVTILEVDPPVDPETARTFEDGFESGRLNAMWTATGAVAVAPGAASAGSFGARLSGGTATSLVLTLPTGGAASRAAVSFVVRTRKLDAGERLDVATRCTGQAWAPLASTAGDFVADKLLVGVGGCDVFEVSFALFASGAKERADLDSVSVQLV
eukprot:TRINITY_DN2996_c0_g1_i7.p1 TRINITY_DN2996_c0_g1~~TRINITY_DN2996_c0_g1_i7.p1  ORF type:complete len:638 (+),score=275.50 TRINITY_DN2996_c0_g1_i7:54-1967(+)